MRLAFRFDTPPDQIPVSELPYFDVRLWGALGAILSVAAINEGRPRDQQLERYLATGYVTDEPREGTYSWFSWENGSLEPPADADPVVILARKVCLVGDDNAWICSWHFKVFGCFLPRSATKWSSSRSEPLLIEQVLNLPEDVTSRATTAFTRIIENVWLAPGRTDEEKREEIVAALDWGEGIWHDRVAIERAALDAVMTLDGGIDCSDDGQDGPAQVIRLTHADVGPENHFIYP
jgi:hypothetical protein